MRSKHTEGKTRDFSFFSTFEYINFNWVVGGDRYNTYNKVTIQLH